LSSLPIFLSKSGLHLTAQRQVKGVAQQETPFASLTISIPHWTERVKAGTSAPVSAKLTPSDPMQSHPEKKVKGAASVEFFSVVPYLTPGFVGEVATISSNLNQLRPEFHQLTPIHASFSLVSRFRLRIVGAQVSQ
jgi:hypothetical protein